MSLRFIGTLVVSGAAALATPVLADSIRTASAFGPNHAGAEGYRIFLETLSNETDGEWTGRDYPSGLVSPGEMVNGLRDGLVDVGSMLMPYFPAEFRESNLPSELALLGTDARVVSGAAAEYLLTCAECMAEFTQINQMYLGATATTPYQIIAVEPVRTPADLEGLRIRTGGAAFSRWAEHFGAIPVQLPAPEVFEGLSQGVIGAHYNAMSDLTAYNLYDLVGGVTEINLGTFNGVSTFSMRLDLWQGLPVETREAFIRAAVVGEAALTFRYIRETEMARERAIEAGIEVIEPDAAFREANAEFVAADLAALPERLESLGITDAPEKIERFQQLVARWQGLVAGVETQEEYAELLMSEIWSNIDLASFPAQ
ncbi:C4-dicarboxylate TRAP transporter substrate-binding protein [Rhodobacter sp. NTK016B]|uniref:C4-dicarboxylate TRAP transporter substrate-binding protein n=1 Tax=Rhodobacter sp. NTK016B TaxID=2759676 RepID=UPI001A8C7D69|nr:C4-dicarboxylate TRAP transporter substrate-binding protein [Rhodobacter sp. NTK016B]MBN8291189.1 C4-dicarboxylate TRAP transporter substrate-binding protein [Rhodobacter sp. NTK016B]